MIKLLVVDDHDLFRGGISKLLDAEPDIDIVGESGEGRKAYDLCKNHSPDVVLLDIDLPDIDGLELNSRLLSRFPDLKTIIVTMYDNEKFAARALSAGAKGYIPKNTTPSEFANAIRKVAGGGVFLPSTLQERVIELRFMKAENNQVQKLTDRELLVLRMLVNGDSLKKIAENINLSESTIRFHRSNIYDKLDINNLADLVKFAIENDLTDTH